MKIKPIVIIGALALLGSTSLPAQDWTQWRGANRDGKVTGFSAPAQWPAQLTQKWSAPVGKGDSTPALVGNMLFTFGRKDTNEVITCFDADSGKVLWEESYAEPYLVTGAPAGHPGPRSSVAVASGKVITLGVAGVLSCVDAKTGKVLWRKQSTNDFEGTPYHFDTSMSPLVTDDLAIVHIGNTNKASVIAFNLATGKPQWKTETEPPSSSSPVLATVGGVKQWVTISAKSLMALNLADGKPLWSMPFEASRGNCTTPVFDGSNVIITGEKKGMICAKIEATGNAFTATPIWTNMPLVSRMTSPVIRDGLAFGYNGQFFCADAKTGTAQWTAHAEGGGTYASVLDCGAVLLGQTLKGDLVAFKPSDKEYTELARYKVSQKEIWAHPVISGKRIFIRDADTVTLWTLD